jgi:hypothetical protein
MSLLQDIQTLQFSDKATAEALLIPFIRDTFPLDVVAVELRPLAVSLNSFNGFMTLADGKRLFFKTHTEPDNVIGEYYHAVMLAEAGYPVLQPLYSSREADRQLLIYEVITDPSVFDLAWQIETGQGGDMVALTRAQQQSDDDLYQIYLNTLELQSAADAAKAPVHQLFYHRLAFGRLARFYGATLSEAEGITVTLPDGVTTMEDVRRALWTINGQGYNDTLERIIARALRLLEPAQADTSIVGHGDAHNGNVFYRPDGLMYFDPAFAGRHHPLLDLTKPLFHNVFAMWMYYPQEKRAGLKISLMREGNHWRVEHDYGLHSVRQMFLKSKVERVLKPIVRELRARGWLRADWRDYLKAALFCCPFLTMNLADETRFPPEIRLLGLSMAVEMGAEGSGKRSLIDQVLDAI